MTLTEEKRATMDDLHRVPGRAELIGGRIVRYMPTGKRPGRIAKLLLMLLWDLERAGQGEAFGDNVAYAVPELSSGRESFSPDVSFFNGPEQSDEMDFIQGA